MGRSSYLRNHRACVLVVMLLVACSSIQQVALGYAENLGCGGSNTWTPGGSFNHMGIGSYSSSTSACTISISPNVATYSAGQTFTMTAQVPGDSVGFKIESVGGAVLTPGAGGLPQANVGQANCINYHGQSSSVSFTMTAPTKGADIKIRAICGKQSGNMYVANEIKLAAGPDVGAPPAVDGPSSDPAFAFQSILTNGLLLRHSRNNTHGTFKLEYSGTGYVSIGLGNQMVGSTVLIGVDTAVNTNMAGVSLYALTSQSANPGTVLASGATLSNFGITDASYAVANGVSSLKWTMVIANQQDKFTFVKSVGSTDTLVWATGGAQFVKHSSYGIYQNFEPGVLAGAGVTGLPIDSKLAAHIATMIVAWEIFSPIGVLIPLFNNAKYGLPGFCRISGPQWLQYHWVLLSLGVLLGYIGFATGYVFVDGRGAIHWSSNHKALGLAILLGSIAQPIWGFLRPAKTKTGEAKTTRRMLFENGHPLLGYILVFAGMANCLLGVSELERIFGGQDYVFGGMQGNTGFKGAMGVIIVLLCAASILSFLLGFIRATLNQSRAPKEGPLSIAIADVKQMEAAGGYRIAKGELQAHGTESNCWVVYKGRVYNVTDFLSTHPGGKKAILPYAGKDMTEAFNNIGHSAEALTILNRYYIGDMDGPKERDPELGLPSPLYASSSSTTFLTGDSSARRQVRLQEKTALSHNVFRLKFALPSPTMTLGLPVGKHIALFAPNITGTQRGRWNGKVDGEANLGEIKRKYTPTSNDQKDRGFFTLVVKCYRPNAQFPDGGKMGRYIDSLKVGDNVVVAGPFGAHQYLGKAVFNDNGREVKATQIAMIAGGSGITPIWQIANAMLSDANDPCKLSVVYANSTIDDILLKSELDDLERRFPNRIKIWYTISKDPKGAPWKYSVGRVSKAMLQKRFPPPSKDALVITCGPEPMMECVSGLLEEMGFSDQQRIDFY